MGAPIIKLVARKGDQVLANFGLEPGDYQIGRDPACEITVPSPEISRHHAILRVSPEQIVLEDVGGKYGTLIDGAQVAGTAAVLPGQIITLGRTTLELHPAAAEPAPQPDRYEAVRQLAKGGMGEVHLAFDRQLERHVALKVMTPELAASPGLAARFTQEALVLGRLDHPHIVPIHDLGTDAQGRNYYAMKFVRGITLKDVLNSLRKGQSKMVDRYPLARLLEIFQKICDAVGYAHSKGIIHRDLKPANIMIGEFGEVLVMDWGIAKILNEPETAPAAAPAAEGGTRYGTVMGTPSYMAPEQAEGRLEAINERTDVYSLGAILYHILTLRPPITRDGPETDLIQRVRAGQITPPLAFNDEVPGAAVLLHCPNREVPEALSAVAMQALARDAAKRYPNATELHRDITAYTAGYAPVAEHAGAFRQFRLTLRRNATLTCAVSLIALIVIGFGVHAHFSKQKQAETLARYKQTAPVFHQTAGRFMAQGLFAEAQTNAQLAAELDPDTAAHWHRLARVQLAQQDPYAALKAIEKTDGTGKFASQAKPLLNRLSDQFGPGPIPLHGMAEVFHWQYRRGMNMDARYTLHRMTAARTNAWKRAQAGMRQLGLSGRLSRDAHGYLDLNLAGTRTPDLEPFARLPVYRLNLIQTRIADLDPLAMMPLRELHLAYCPATDLEPLRDRPLQTLTIAYAPVEDLEPLTGAPLANLKLSGTRIKNLSPLTKMPLRTLHLDRTPVTDLKPLAGLPLRELRLDGCENLRDLSPLAQCTQLETLTLPRNHGNIEFLKNLPNLKRLSYFYDTKNPAKVEPATQFWRTRAIASRR